MAHLVLFSKYFLKQMAGGSQFGLGGVSPIEK